MKENIKMQNTLTPTFCLEGAQNSMNQFKELMESRPKKENEPFISLNIYQAEKVIQDFKNLQFTKVQRKSFIEIMGLNHLESVSSKTLAFFLNTQEIHNLDDLVISALLNKIGKNISYQIHTENVILEKKRIKGELIFGLKQMSILLSLKTRSIIILKIIPLKIMSPMLKSMFTIHKIKN